MPFTGSGTGIQNANDVFFSGLAANQVLRYNTATSKWVNVGLTLTVADLPAGSTVTVAKSGGSWPARPTSRNDIVVQWKGPEPSPAIVSSGTGGMLDNVDIRFVTP